MSVPDSVWVTVAGAVGPAFRAEADAMTWLASQRNAQIARAAQTKRSKHMDEADLWVGEIETHEDGAWYRCGRLLTAGAVRKTRVY